MTTREHSPLSPAPVIEMLDVGKTYSSGSLSVEALKNVNIYIEPNDFVAVIGPSGPGTPTS